MKNLNFKIINFEIIKHSFFVPQKFNFTNDDLQLSEGPYVTLLIGSNGTGKSQLLELLIKIFNNLIASKSSGKKAIKFDSNFKLTYTIDNKLIDVTSVNNNEEYFIDNISVELNDLLLPNKILACANNLGDKFPFLTSKSKTQNNSYHYLGIRTASNNAFKNYNTLIDRFSKSLLISSNIEKYKNIFNLLDLEPEITIIYKAGKNLSIDKKDNRFVDVNNPELLYNKFEKVITKNSSNSRFTFRKDKYSNVIYLKNESNQFEPNYSNLKLVSDFINNYNNSFEGKKTKSSLKYQSQINFGISQTIEEFKSKSKVLQLIRDLELFEVEKLILHRKKSKYGFENASSGEHHILSGFINIISTIEDNSVVFIDEPEISLHPNWQLKYMHLLQSTFKEKKDCHFIISTHSHFLVSDIQPESSAIISLKLNENGRPINETLVFDTYGWSAENILYRVFDVSTTRNHYFEMELRELLTLISNKSNNIDRIKELAKSINRFNTLNEDDPLKQIINTAYNYIDINGN